ncbi:hypothetical protein Q7P37_003125 [Cladosporium fusiforme]
MYVFVLTLAAGLIPCLMKSVQCNGATSYHPASNIIHRRVDEVETYSKMHPGGLADYELRSSDSHATAGDHGMQGLSQTIDLVTRTYGLRDSESFYWGRDGNPYANLTAFADGKDIKVLSLERFSDVLQAAECSKNSVKLTFAQEVEFDQVHQAWQWIDDADENYVILVTENERCNIGDGDPTVRQPWHISSAAFNDDTNEVTLTAEPRTWDQAFSNWHLKLNSKGILPHDEQQKLLRRNVHGQKRAVIDFDASIPLDANFSGITASLKSIDGPNNVNRASASISCAECHTDGSIDFDIDVTPWLWDPSDPFEGAHLDGYVKFSAADVSATIQLKITATGAAPGYHDSFTLAKWDPNTRIYIAGVIDLGPEIKYDIESDIGRVESSVDVTAGLVVKIPPNSIYYQNFDDSSKDRVSDWTPILEGLPTDIGNTASLEFSVGGALKLSLAGDVLGLASAEIGVALAAPIFKGHLNVVDDENPCQDSNGASGNSFEVDVGMALEAYEVATIVAVEAKAEQTFFSTAAHLYSACIATGLGAQPTAAE